MRDESEWCGEACEREAWGRGIGMGRLSWIALGRTGRKSKTLCANAVSHPPPCTPLISALFTEAGLQQPTLEGKVQMGLA